MATGGGFSALAAAEIVAGVILAWSGIENQTITATLGSLLRGQAPTPGPAGPPGSTSSSSAPASSSGGSSSAPATAPASGGSPGAAFGCTAGQTAANKATMQLMAAGYGWALGSEWNALNGVIMLESRYCNIAQNPGSTAYGIGQFLDSTWSEVGYSKTSNAVTQIAATLKYIKQRYGTPSKAYAFHIANGWY